MSYTNTRHRPSGSRPSYNSRNRSPVRRHGGFSKQNIHPSKFVKAAKAVDAVVHEPKNKFTDFSVLPALKNNIIVKGYITPSQIQDEAIPPALLGKDVIGIANTGTGKTAAFAIPVLNRLGLNRQSKALIIAPTRELAMQINDEFRSLAGGLGLFGTILIGGMPMMPQVRNLQRNPHIVIGTPGRIKDHIERKNINLLHFDVVVLDEVDRMLDMGFIVDIRFILDRMSKPRQSFFFSATMDRKVNDLISTFSNDPVTISVKQGDTSDNVEQNVVYVESGKNKIDKLQDVLLQAGVNKVLVFDETKHSVERLGKTLAERGFKADALHGGKSQGQRKRALDRFRRNEINILVATDVAARGIDVIDITHVINYSTPNTYDDYVHRIGRAGRAGRKGHALTFIN